MSERRVLVRLDGRPAERGDKGRRGRLVEVGEGPELQELIDAGRAVVVAVQEPLIPGEGVEECASG